jgi:dihydrofolate reductase
VGQLIVHCQVTLNGAFDAPSPENWLVMDPDSGQASFEQLVLADALVLGRKTYEGWLPSGRTLATIPRWDRSPTGSTRCRST